MPCPELDALESHVAGRIDVSDHIEGCASCAERLREISENLEALSGMKEALADEPLEPETPERIGPFAVVREIGRGGMGVVYLARQERPRREVALKVLRPGVASADTLRRFELEADLLARLRHPGIATIYEAGVTTVSSAGAVERVPYIAMEYVRGERLDRFAASRKLSHAQRLDVLARVADAVHHAHMKGLVHRDLKPANILVELENGAGAPKILDFGVARITDGEPGETRRTSAGQILGTVPYMSPEQLGDDPSVVDARSDVHALGVIGFELLTGEVPHAAKTVSVAEAVRRIRDEQPRPPGRIDPRLRGDVETILLKALEKDPSRRYTSAAELAADIRRFLKHEPIQARPQSAAYQLRRFAQRNRALVVSLAALALALAAAAGVSIVLALRAEARLVEARRQAEKFEAVNRFLEEMLAASSPEDRTGGVDVTVRQMLESATETVDAGSLTDQPEIELGVRTTIGNAYRALGEYPAAESQLDRAVEIGRRLHPDGHEELAYVLNKRGRLAVGSGDFDAAEAAFRESLEMRTRLLGPRHEDVAVSLNNLADVLGRRGDRQASLAMHLEALAIRRERLGPAHVDIATSLNNIAVAQYSLGDMEAAESLLTESLEMDRTLRGELHPNVLKTMNNLAVVTSRLGKPEESERLQRRTVELQREIFGGAHPELANSLQNLAHFLVKQDKLDEAEPLFVEALEMDRELRGERHPHVASVLGNFAGLFEARGEKRRATALHEEGLAIRRDALGDDHPETLQSRFELARIAVDAEAFSSVAQDARRLLPGSRQLFTTLHGYALCLLELGRSDDAAAILREARDVGSGLVDESDPRLREIERLLAELR